MTNLFNYAKDLSVLHAEELAADAEYLRLERICIMREGNNIPDNQPTPPEILEVANKQAEEFINTLQKSKQE